MAISLDGVEAVVAGLSGDGVSVGSIAGALGNESSAESVPAEFGDCCGGVAGATADGLVDRRPRQGRDTKIALIAIARNQRCSGVSSRYSHTAHMPLEQFWFEHPALHQRTRN